MWYAEGSSKFILGSDGVGRDVLSRVIHGARISLMVASFSLASGIVIGTFVGIISGYAGGLLDEVVMRIVDIWAAVPFLIFAMVVVIVFGSSITTLMGLLVLLAWSSFVRNIRGEVLSLKERDYVALAKVAGASPLRIMIRHILPGVANTAIVIATLRLGSLILAAAALSFLGAGIPAPTPSWGGMVAGGREFLATAWWISFFPGLSIFLLVMSLNFLGDWLRDRFDPRLRQL
jgi:peptide/nickel transport system permease protein